MSSPSALKLSGFWRNQLRQWHWISSALCLAGLLMFAVTGFTLNHATTISAKPITVRIEKDLSTSDQALMVQAKDKAPLPDPLAAAVKAQTRADVRGIAADVSDDDIFVDLAGPGIDASVTIDKADGHITYEHTYRGVIAVLNDLHKGRHTGALWSVFIDVLAIACVIFSVTGLGLLWLHARNRRITWPLVAAGIVVPLILFLLFVHA
jgi:hypothetical protein